MPSASALASRRRLHPRVSTGQRGAALRPSPRAAAGPGTRTGRTKGTRGTGTTRTRAAWPWPWTSPPAAGSSWGTRPGTRRSVCLCSPVGLPGGGGRDALEGWRYPPPPLHSAQPMLEPLSPCRQVPASMAFVTDSNRPQPLWQPPPTACLTTFGTASEVPSLLMHPWGGGGAWSPRKFGGGCGKGLQGPPAHFLNTNA